VSTDNFLTAAASVTVTQAPSPTPAQALMPHSFPGTRILRKSWVGPPGPPGPRGSPWTRSSPIKIAIIRAAHADGGVGLDLAHSSRRSAASLPQPRRPVRR
jgi:hypothetical protein